MARPRNPREEGIQRGDQRGGGIPLEGGEPRTALEDLPDDTCGCVAEEGWVPCPENLCERPDHFERHRPDDPSADRIKPE